MEARGDEWEMGGGKSRGNVLGNLEGRGGVDACGSARLYLHYR